MPHLRLQFQQTVSLVQWSLNSLRGFDPRSGKTKDYNIYICCFSALELTSSSLTSSRHFPVLFSFMTYHRVYNQSNMMGVSSRAGTIYPSGPLAFTPGFQQYSCCSIFGFLCGVQQIVVCPFDLFLMAVVFSVLLRFADSDCLFGIFKLFLVFIPLITSLYSLTMT